MLKMLSRVAIALIAGALLASPAAAHRSHHNWRPYVIEKVCDYQWGHCKVRMDYAPGQHAGLAGSGSYWYRHAHHHRHHSHHHHGSRHVAWCRSHYRTYDRHSDTFVGRGYQRYRCISPY